MREAYAIFLIVPLFKGGFEYPTVFQPPSLPPRIEGWVHISPLGKGKLVGVREYFLCHFKLRKTLFPLGKIPFLC
jgi:hypothetical protein